MTLQPDDEMIALEAGLADLMNEWECPEDRDYGMQCTDYIEWSGTRHEIVREASEPDRRHWASAAELREKIRSYYRRIHDTAVLGLTPAEDSERILTAIEDEAERVAAMSPEIQRAYLAAHETR